MAKITVNLTTTSLEFENLPIGSYTATITEVSQENSKAMKPMLKIKLNVTWQGFEGRVAFLYCSLEANALFSLGYVLLAADLYDKEELKKGAIEFDPDDLIGKEIGLLVTRDRKNPANVNMRAIDRTDATGPSQDAPMTTTAAAPAASGVASLF